MRTYIDQCAREHGMTRAQWAVLARLERQEGMTQAEMADALEIQPISLVRLIDRLCEQGLVERRPHPTRPARQSPLPHRQGPRHACRAWCRWRARSRAMCLPLLARADVAELLRQAAVAQEQHPQSRGASQGSAPAGSEVRHAR